MATNQEKIAKSTEAPDSLAHCTDSEALAYPPDFSASVSDIRAENLDSEKSLDMKELTDSLANVTDEHDGSSTEGPFQIYDYRIPGDRVGYVKFADWRDKINDLTKNKIIVEWTNYKTPLRLASGKFLPKFGKNRGGYHSYIIFKVADKNDKDAVEFVSFEKGPSGILFQIDKQLKSLKDRRVSN